MSDNQTINLVEFINQSQFIGFDYLLAVIEKSNDGKNLKIPIKGVTNFTSPDVIVKELDVIKKSIANPTEVKQSLVGLILKKEIGLKIFDKQLVVIDIDCKRNAEEGKIVLQQVLDFLTTNFGMIESELIKCIEKT